jgi:hypothetical protein
MTKFKAFKEPKHPDDTPLVSAHGFFYRCNGCGCDQLPQGFWITERIEDGMVVGLSMRIGADGAIVHACGKAVE